MSLPLPPQFNPSVFDLGEGADKIGPCGLCHGWIDPELHVKVVLAQFPGSKAIRYYHMACYEGLWCEFAEVANG